MKPSSAREAISVWRRYMELPRYLRAVQGRADLMRVLGEVVCELGLARPCVISGPTVTRELGREIAAELASPSGSALCALENSGGHVETLAATTEVRDADVVVGVGGGRTIDVAKSVCETVDLPVIVVPTQLTADGIASPVSVIRTHSGEVTSRRARLPIAVVVDLEWVLRSPAESARAGLGDLLANTCAIRDWRRAAAAGRGAVDDFAALLSQTASDLVFATDVAALGRGAIEPGFLHRLLRGLVLSGLAMEIAGSSRPCSGSEHLVSHALDRLHPGIARHGEQVAFGAIVCTRLQGEDWRALKAFMVRAGMGRATRGFGLTRDELVEVVQAAPTTRPGRYTVLDEVDPAADSLRPMVGEVLER